MWWRIAALGSVVALGAFGVTPGPSVRAAVPDLVLAEGTTLPGFQEYLTLLDSGPSASVIVTYLFSSGRPPQTQPLSLPARSRTTVDVNQTVGEGRDVAIGVDTGGNPDITVERPLYFEACPGSVCVQGSDVGEAVAPATTWYLAEGYTGTGFQEYLTMVDPGQMAADVVVTYHFADGPAMTQDLSLAAEARVTVDVNQMVGAGRQVSATVVASQLIVVERPEYVDGCAGGVCVDGGSVSSGATPTLGATLAEGTTLPGFQEYLTLLDPGPTPAQATVTYVFGPGQGPSLVRAYPIGAGARLTIDVDGEVGPGRDVAVRVDSTQPVVVERPQYYAFDLPDGTAVRGTSVGVGLQPRTVWRFAEGYTGPGFGEYLTLGNLGRSPATATLTYLFADGSSPQTADVQVPALSRVTVDVNAVVGSSRQVSVMVQSDQPLAAERPMYFSGCLGQPEVCVHRPHVLDHFFVLVMENHSWSDIVGNPAAPYLNGLLGQGAVASSYWAVSHPSLPNYLALVGGSTFGVTDDCTSCSVSAANLADRVEASGRSWKAYMEGMPTPCFAGSSYPYAQKHDPFVYFDDIRDDPARCGHVVPYSQLPGDLATAASTPSLGWITPDLCHDMHDCSVAAGDAWLQQQVPSILASPAFTRQDSVLAITWDEGTSDNHVLCLLLGPRVRAGHSSDQPYGHYSLLRTVEAAWSLGPLAGGDGGVPPMGDLFMQPSPPG